MPFLAPRTSSSVGTLVVGSISVASRMATTLFYDSSSYIVVLVVFILWSVFSCLILKESLSGLLIPTITN